MVNRLIGVLIGVFLGLQAASAVTRHVQIWGDNNMDCGSTTNPCQSINHAVGLSGANDRIIVGPGYYQAATISIEVPGLKIESTHGARATTLEKISLDLNSLINISESKVRFGKRGKGLTVLGGVGNDNGGVEITTDLMRGIRIEGNIARSNSNGFVLRGSKIQVRYNTARDNNGDGFQVNNADGMDLRNNTAHSNGGYGFNMDGVGINLQENVSEENDAGGIVVNSYGISAAKVRNNVADRNFDGYGFGLSDGIRSRVEGNISVGNFADAFFVFSNVESVFKNNLAVGRLGSSAWNGFELSQSTDVVIQNNTAANSGGPGLLVNEFTTLKTVKANNYFGSGASGCGIAVESPSTVSYSRNFFGAPPNVTPGPDVNNDSDRHDAVCGDDGMVTNSEVTGTNATRQNKTNTRKASRL